MERVKKSSKFNKKILILIISLCVLLIGIVVTIIFITTKSSTPETDPRSFEEIYWDSETAEEAIETFQQKIDTTTDPEQKAELYNERANFLFLNFSTNDMFVDQILNDASKAKEVFLSEDTEMFYSAMHLYYESSAESISE